MADHLSYLSVSEKVFPPGKNFELCLLYSVLTIVIRFS